MSFKVGQSIKCVKPFAGRLKFNTTYEVLGQRIEQGHLMVMVENDRAGQKWWFADRFESLQVASQSSVR